MQCRLLASNPTDRGVDPLLGDCTADEAASAAPARTVVAPAQPSDPGLPTRPCPHCSQALPCTAQQCPACGGLSPAWILHEGRWWTRDAAGTLYWHDPATNAWIRYAAHTA